MRNVTSLPIPGSLQRNAKRWTRELLVELKKRKVLTKDPLFNRYNQNVDVKNTLKEMYNTCCCFCGADIEPVSFGHIEHRKPKKTYPKSTYDWDNLHLVCDPCNISKGNKYSKRHPILDAVADVPVSDFLRYKTYLDKTYVKHLHPRGETTRVHADLNRDPLLDGRFKVNQKTLNLIEVINDAIEENKLDERDMDVELIELKDKTKKTYGGLIEQLCKTYLHPQVKDEVLDDN
ncbi:HNH endonuclease [candidate division KSB1 bacterium]|nr:HNH endonuclease [candidate division KSB1 bacterium]